MNDRPSSSPALLMLYLGLFVATFLFSTVCFSCVTVAASHAWRRRRQIPWIFRSRVSFSLDFAKLSKVGLDVGVVDVLRETPMQRSFRGNLHSESIWWQQLRLFQKPYSSSLRKIFAEFPDDFFFIVDLKLKAVGKSQLQPLSVQTAVTTVCLIHYNEKRSHLRILQISCCRLPELLWRCQCPRRHFLAGRRDSITVLSFKRFLLNRHEGSSLIQSTKKTL